MALVLSAANLLGRKHCTSIECDAPSTIILGFIGRFGGKNEQGDNMALSEA